MMDKTGLLSVFTVMAKCFRANKILLILVPCCLIVTGISSYLNLWAADSFIQTNNLYEKSSPEEGFDGFLKSLGIVISHYFFSQIAHFVSSICSLFVFRAFLCESVNRYTDMDYTEFHTKGSGRIQDNISRSSRAAREISAIISYEIPRSLIEFIQAYIKLYNQLSIDYFRKFFGLFCVSATISFFIAFFFFKKERYIVSLYKRSFIPLSDILQNFDVMRAFNNEEVEVYKYRDSLDPFMSNNLKYQVLKSVLLFLQKTCLFLPHVLIYYETSKNKPVWKEDKVDITVISKYNRYFSELKKSAISMRDSAFMFIRESSEMKTDLNFSTKKRVDPRLVDKESFDYRIELDNVDLYAGNNIVQRKQSFTINKGDKVAITGTNGAGKSVFIKTLLKFFKNEGKFYIDGVLIQDISTKSLRNLISYVPQDPYIFNTTVLNNLGYSQKNIDEAAIYKHCEAFDVHEFFKSMRDGYNTEAGEKGKYLSGGQKQRISFMRAIIKDAPILVMDEPTANIDKSSEESLIDNALKHCGDKTFVLIVHNLDMLKKFDKILYFTKEGVSCFESPEDFENQTQQLIQKE